MSSETTIELEKKEFFLENPEPREKVAIIGTGNYGVALGKRLIQYGFEVVFGSRNPDIEYLKKCFETSNEEYFAVTTIDKAFRQADKFVFLAVNASDSVYKNVVDQIFADIVENKEKIVESKRISKIIIDVSNLLDKKSKISNAEKLNHLFKSKISEQQAPFYYDLNIVKGFNQVNAYSMGSDQTEKKGNVEIVSIAGDDAQSKDQVVKFSSKIGFQACDVGPLRNALELELANQRTFPDWLYPSILCIAYSMFNFLFVFTFYYFFPKKPHTLQQYLKNVSSLAILNKSLGYTALQLLAFVYLGSVIAGFFQLKSGTKYKRFPYLLDAYLRTRKQFGLWAFLFACIHVIASLLTVNPSYQSEWFKTTSVNLNGYNHVIFGKMRFVIEVAMLFGILGFILMSLVALTSINSIATSLNWSEWRFVQTKIGLSALFAALMHDFFMYWRIYIDKDEKNFSTLYMWTRVKLIAIYFPLLVLILRFIFAYFPPISKRLENIRNGNVVSKKN
jgi:metalloreductase STEAP3